MTSRNSTVTRWTNRELNTLKRHGNPDKIQSLLDQLPYRCESVHLCARAALRDNQAHCFDGALLAAAALTRSGYAPMLIDLRAEQDDDHILCAYRWRGYWGAVAKSNFPGLRFREPIFRSPRELVLSYFELYFSMKGAKSLREYSRPLRLPSLKRLDWECDDSSGDLLVDRLDSSPHYKIITPHQKLNLRKIDRRFFQSQLVGVNLKGVY
ncbi:MAG: hypothetical protein ACK5Y6_07220, partial [Pseudomonadota bacterium]